MKSVRKGFTLIELMVVVLIIGILASVGVPRYLKTVETSRASDAVAINHMLANAYRMYKIDHPSAAENLSGLMTDACNTTNCQPTDRSACRLVRCQYVAAQQWGTGPGGASYYVYQVGQASCGGRAACTRRNGGNSPYNTWNYSFDMNGTCFASGTSVPSCPRF
jgi:type II secretion system protein G